MPLSNLPAMLRCACGNLRRTTRTITMFYDKQLQPTGLRSTQCSLLVVIALRQGITVSELGEQLFMDQTTVTRNLAILKKQGYVDIVRVAGDARKKAVSVTEKGAIKLAQAMPLWQQAQAQIEQGLGQERFGAFLQTLNNITKIVQ